MTPTQVPYRYYSREGQLVNFAVWMLDCTRCAFYDLALKQRVVPGAVRFVGDRQNGLLRAHVSGWAHSQLYHWQNIIRAETGEKHAIGHLLRDAATGYALEVAKGATPEQAKMLESWWSTSGWNPQELA
jgi:hypothetical protein